MTLDSTLLRRPKRISVVVGIASPYPMTASHQKWQLLRRALGAVLAPEAVALLAPTLDWVGADRDVSVSCTLCWAVDFQNCLKPSEKIHEYQ